MFVCIEEPLGVKLKLSSAVRAFATPYQERNGQGHESNGTRLGHAYPGELGELCEGGFQTPASSRSELPVGRQHVQIKGVHLAVAIEVADAPEGSGL